MTDTQDRPTMTLSFNIPGFTRRVAPTISPRRDIDFKAIATERERFTDEAREAHRVHLHEISAANGENFLYLAMSFQPYRWADMYNTAADEYTEMSALAALDVWARYLRGDYAMMFSGGVK